MLRKYRILPGHSFRLDNGDIVTDAEIELPEDLAELHAGKLQAVPEEASVAATGTGDASADALV